MHTWLKRPIALALTGALLFDPGIAQALSRTSEDAPARTPLSCPSREFDQNALALAALWTLFSSQPAIAASVRQAAVAPDVISLIDTLSPPGTFHFLNGILQFILMTWSITLHELGHVRQSRKEGDIFPMMAGQESLKPWKFVGPASTTVALVTSLFGYPLMGMATHVHPKLVALENRRALGRIALQGPVVSVLVGILLAGVGVTCKLITPGNIPWIAGLTRQFVIAGVANVALAILNLIPLSMFDGQKILQGFIPQRFAKIFRILTLGFGTVVLLVALVADFIKSLSHSVLTPSGESAAAGGYFAYLHHPYVVGLLAGIWTLWVIAVIPASRRQLPRWREALLQRAQLRAGTAFLIRISTGQMTAGTMRPYEHLRRYAISWPRSKPKPEYADFTFNAVRQFPSSSPRRNEVAVRIDTGERIRLDRRMSGALSRGEFMLLRSQKTKKLFILPADVLGGPAAVKTQLETGIAAMAVGEDGNAMDLLLPGEIESIRELARRVGKPVYEIDSRILHRAYRIGHFAINAHETPVFLVQRWVLRGLAALRPANRAKVIAWVGDFLEALASGIQQPGSLNSARRSYLLKHPAFTRWSVRVSRSA